MDTPTMARRPERTPRHAGFTITELLVVIAVISLIVTLIIPTITKVRARARTMKCLTNQRQITQANYAYTGDNNGRFVCPRTDSFGSMYLNGTNVPNSTTHCWVRAEGSNVTSTFEKVSALEQGTLWSYIGSVQTYLSPDEPTNAYGNLNPDANTRVRSYSINACLGVTRPDEWPAFDDYFVRPLDGVADTSAPLSTYNTQTVARVLQPARMMSTVVEDDNKAFNKEGWIIQPQPSVREWIDLPAPWRPDAVTLTYVDGSTDSREMVNPDICAANYGPPYPGGIVVSGNDPPHRARAPTDTSGTDTDWRWFRERLNPGILPPLPGFPGFPE